MQLTAESPMRLGMLRLGRVWKYPEDYGYLSYVLLMKKAHTP
jgi:hypothetical protein